MNAGWMDWRGWAEVQRLETAQDNRWPRRYRFRCTICKTDIPYTRDAGSNLIISPCENEHCQAVLVLQGTELTGTGWAER